MKLSKKTEEAEETKKIKVEADGGMTVCLSAEGCVESLVTSDYNVVKTEGGCSDVTYKIVLLLDLKNVGTVDVDDPHITKIEGVNDG